jgi:DNA recombination protein RmuC
MTWDPFHPPAFHAPHGHPNRSETENRMSPLDILLLIALLLMFLGFLWALLRGRGPEVNPAAQMLQQQLSEIRDQTAHLSQTLSQSLMDATGKLSQQVENQLHQVRNEVQDRLKEQTGTLQNTQDAVGKRLDNAARVVQEVSSKLGQLEESQKRIHDVGKDIASLQEILKAPKLRGGLGELFLGDLLQQVLPAAHFTLQYPFTDSLKVDAVLRVGGRLVPVDSKFPMENFRRVLDAPDEAEKRKRRKEFSRDVEKHVSDIASKYIRPAENTYDFALMYIPAENVYYEVIIRDEEGSTIGSTALEKRVIPVSPNSFYAYLQVILLGLKGLELESKTREILEHLQQIDGHLGAFRESFEKLGAQLGHARQNYDRAQRDLDKLGDRLGNLTSRPETQPKLPEH